jgi:hypothetical protein
LCEVAHRKVPSEGDKSEEAEAAEPETGDTAA